MTAPTDQLTEKEKETLRLIVHGHDAKSAASELSLSVHTINERLRSARRKLDVTSSREAARVLLEAERVTSENLVPKEIGEAPAGLSDEEDAHHGRNYAPWIGVSFVMSIIAAIAVFAFAGVDPASNQTPSAEVVNADTERERVAREWLGHTDNGELEASFATSASALRSAIDLATFTSATNAARAPLGEVLDRRAIQFTTISEGGKNYEIVLFRTDFANRKGVIERVAMERDGAVLKVGGYWIQ
jgi:DNA-binding CsgD family transcriptional regulator